MRSLRLVNPRIGRHTAAETLDQILGDTSPRVRRFRRRSAWRARWSWAHQHSRWITVPGLLLAFFLGFWIQFGVTGLAAAMLSVGCAAGVTGLLYAYERHVDGPRNTSGRGGWIA